MIESLPKFLFLFKGPDEDPAVFRIDFDDFMKDAGINAVLVPKGIRRDGDELIDVVDNLADIIGNASGRIGRVGSFLECDDVQIGPEPLCLGRRAHPRGIPAYDDKSFL
jgi:hypothetical protein